LTESIDKPLGFYVLALLIVESFIATVAWRAGAERAILPWGLGLGVGMFVYVTFLVTLLAWHKPHVLTFDRDAHLRDRKLNAPFGNERKPVKTPEKLSAPTNAKDSA
jgi:hypothetical protein